MTAEGQILNRRYRLIRRLGIGGMGSVWQAEDLKLERMVAAKELVPDTRGIPLAEHRIRAEVEARAMARVRHPAIVRIYDLISVGDDPWIVMDYILGRSLAEIIRDDRQSLDERAIAAVGLPVIQGLRAVHAADVVHRDVKPANILVAQDGAILLVDFGIAKIAGDPSLTGSTRVLGTTEFLAPERFSDFPAGPPADLWAFGVTLFCAMEGYSPFLRRGERSMEATVAAILRDDPPEPRDPGPLAELVLQLLRKEPAERPSATSVAGLLEKILSGTARPSPAVPPRQQLVASAPGRARARAGERIETPLAGMPISDAVEIVSKSSTDSGVTMLLGMPEESAARILARCSRRVAAGLLQGMAQTHGGTAGRILQIFAASMAGQVLDRVSTAAAASILAGMPVSEAVRILRESDVRTVAGALTEMPDGVSASLLWQMPEDRAADVLGHVKPASAASMLRAVSGERQGRLLRRLNPAFRDLVKRYM